MDNKQSSYWIYAGIAILLAWTSIKLSLPALPELGKFFHTNENLLKLSISLLLICMAVSQLIWGAVSDNIGRKPVLILALIITAYGTLMVATSYSIVMFIIGRCLEGVGVGGFSPTGRAILADCYDRLSMSKKLASISAMAGLIPFLAPVAGGYLLLLGWRSIFLLYFILLLIFSIFLLRNVPETRQGPAIEHPIRHALKNYSTIARTPSYWGFIICYMLMSGPLIGYYAAMPFWYITQWHLSEHTYAYLAIGPALFNITGLMISRRLVKHFAIEKALFCILLGGVVIAGIALALALSQLISLWLLAGLFTLYAFVVGCTFPLANVGALSTNKDCPASVSALSTFLMFSSASGFASIETHLNVSTLWPVAILMLGCTIGMLLIFSVFTYRPYIRSR